MLNCFTDNNSNAITIELINKADYSHWLEQQSPSTTKWLSVNSFSGKAGSQSLIPSSDGNIDKVIYIHDKQQPLWSFATLAAKLPEGIYVVSDEQQLPIIALAWGLHCYQFDRYKKSTKKYPQLLISNKELLTSVSHLISSSYLIRDLINTPTEDMGPAQLAETAEHLAKEHNAKCSQIIGEQLVLENYPAIYTVGRASTLAPRLIELNWGDDKHPAVTLVGKGVCFDSGGLNMKPGNFMRQMKKDMGGAAHVLGLAKLIMAEQLPIKLRVLIPAVENSVAGNAYRPGDVITTRKGLTVEVGNTDAEGRLVLADALTEAIAEKPELIIDFATLTGAARVALGTDIPVYFTNDDTIAGELQQSSETANDLMWRLPLHKPYRKLIDSPIADIDNSGSSSFGGAITAALFLQEFVEDTPWVHIDLMAYNNTSRPGRPEGGEAMALRAVFGYLQQRFLTS